MKLIPILAAIVGVLSLVANIALGYSTYTLNTQKNAVQERLNAQISEYNYQMKNLKNAKSALIAANYQNELLQQDVKTAKAETNTFRDRATKAEYFVERAKCYTMLDENKAYAATSNAGIKPALINTLESAYSGRIQSSSITTYWNDSNSALFTALWGDGSTKTVLSWDRKGNLKTVFDINEGCVMYTR
jgi:Tfp pilus assembly protein PilE